MMFEVRLPYPLTLARKGNKKLVLFIEKPTVRLTTANPWALLPLRGACLFEDGKLKRLEEIEDELTLAVVSFDPKPGRLDPEDALEQLLSKKGSCWKSLWGEEAMVCGDIALFLGSRSLPPLGFGIVKTRVDLIGPRIRLKA